MLIPRKRPSRQRLMDCRLVSHRGEHDNRRTRENTLAAFRAVAAAGIWGIEFDVRWTRDLHPVVIHDPTSGRVFGKDLSVADVSLEQLRRQIPEIPTLEEVVAEFGGHTHLMVELKHDRLDRDEIKAARLEEIFSALRAGRDFYFLALQADLFEPVAFAGASSCLLVAELDISRFSRQVIDNGYGGLCGHYLLLSNALLERHHAQGQKLGSGFPASRQCFYRELNRGVDWVFTNRALKLGAIRRCLLERD
ncbi:MAG: glycerophosphodiester phosphodiesterase family protein [Gammaproteobacteria bacterium]|nr:glycerophosphodiester phosphodiesterase family protein [Gammaproteobacteria bacterium]